MAEKHTIKYSFSQNNFKNEVVCGDLVYHYMEGDVFFAAVIDVAGHGPEARKLAVEIDHHLKARKISPTPEALQDLHKYFVHSKGFVCTLLSLNTINLELVICGIGNVTNRLIGKTDKRLLNRDGIIGYSIPNPKPHKITLTKDDLVLIYTDGIINHFNRDDYRSIVVDDAEDVAEHILKHFSKEDDDSTCLAIKVVS